MKYYDYNGNEKTLFRMIRDEPDWIENRFKVMENEIKEKKYEKKKDKAKRELKDYKRLISEIWNEDLTDQQELIYLKFYKAGIKMGEPNHE